MATILFADDDPEFRRAYAEYLRNRGHEVIEAENGRDALKQLPRQPVDLAIIDVFMPEREGLEVIREMRQKTPDLKIIAISGGSKHIEASLGLQLAKQFGADKIINKPFLPSELLEHINELAGAL